MSSLPVPVSPADEHGGVGGGDGFDLLQHPAQGGAPADHLVEVVFGADLFFQVDLLLVQFVLERLDLFEGQGVLHGHGHLVGDLLEKIQVRGVIGPRLPGPEHERAQPAPRRGEGQAAQAVDPKGLHPLQVRRPPSCLRLGRKDQRFLSLQDQLHGVTFDRSNFRGLGRERFRAFQEVQPERVARGIVQGQAQVIEAHHLLKPTGQVVKQSLQIAVGDDRFGDR